ncbi:MAG: hypothetical protein U5M51_06040 [Emticicia sp.]|nr:hypothetical protein [Emticicia sp.]
MKHSTLLTTLFVIVFFQSSGQVIHKGFNFKIGRFYSSSFDDLSERLQRNNLRGFNSPFFTFGFEYSLQTKKCITFGFEQSVLLQNQSSVDYNLALNTTCLIINGGYQIVKKEKFSLTPQIGIGLSPVSLVVSDKILPNVSGFDNALVVNGTRNSLINLQGLVQLSVLAEYKIKVGDKSEKIEGGSVVSERKLPIGLEVGLRRGNTITEWVLLR